MIYSLISVTKLRPILQNPFCEDSLDPNYSLQDIQRLPSRKLIVRLTIPMPLLSLEAPSPTVR